MRYLVVFSLLLAACGGTTAAPDAGPSDSGAGPDLGADAGVAPGDAGHDASAPDAGPRTVTLTLTSFAVGAGVEVYKCQNFANPLGADFDVGEIESHGGAATLMTTVFERPGTTDGALEDCTGAEMYDVHYASEETDGDLRYPAGAAAHMSGANGFRVQVHALGGASDDTVTTTIVLHLVDAATVTAKAGMLYGVHLAIAVPPAASGVTVTHDCLLPQAMTLLTASSVMFDHGTSFTATLDGAALYDTTQWRNPAPAVLSPPLVAASGAMLHFACTYDNPGATSLHFGPSALTDEQCTFFAPFVGVADGALVTVYCN